MAYLVTMISPAFGHHGEERSLSFETATDEEATRIAQEGTLAASRKGESVTYEIHDPEGRLVMSYTSAVTNAGAPCI